MEGGRTVETLTCSYCGSDRAFGKACQCCPYGEPSAFEIIVDRIDAGFAQIDLSARAASTPALLSRSKAAKLMGVSRGRTLPDLIRAGRVHTVKVNGRTRIPLSEIANIRSDDPPRRRAAHPTREAWSEPPLAKDEIAKMKTKN